MISKWRGNKRPNNSTDQVSSGNFYVQVPIRRSEGDLAHLGETFNKMTAELRRQRDGLVTASEVIDRRRRFTETVLSGVSSGVLSLDGDGHITIINRSAESLLGTGGRLGVQGGSTDASREVDGKPRQ